MSTESSSKEMLKMTYMTLTFNFLTESMEALLFSPGPPWERFDRSEVSVPLRRTPSTPGPELRGNLGNNQGTNFHVTAADRN